MKHKVVSIIVPIVVVATVVAGIAYAVTRDSGGPDAYTIDGQSMSQASLNQELDVLVGHKLVSSNTPGSIDATAATSWLTLRIRSAAIAILLADNDLELTAAVRAAVRKQVPNFKQLPRSIQEVVYAYTGGGALLVDKLGEGGANSAVAKAARTFDVSVDPKYGRWVRARGQVCPVTGCPAAASASSSGG